MANEEQKRQVSQALLDRIVDRDNLLLLNESRLNKLLNLSSNYVKMAITELLHNLQESFFPEQKMWLSPQTAEVKNLAKS